MTFPTIPTAANGRISYNFQLNTQATRTFPALSGITKNAGDLLLAIIVTYTGATGSVFSGWTQGFTELIAGGLGTNCAIGVAYKWSNGSETAAPQVTQAGTIDGDAEMLIMSIPGAHASQIPSATSVVVGANVSPATSDTLTTSWGVEDNLFIGICGIGETSTSGAFTGITNSVPSGYSDLYLGGITRDMIGGVQLAVAFRAAASNMVTCSWAVDSSNARWATAIVAIRPAAEVTNWDTVGQWGVPV